MVQDLTSLFGLSAAPGAGGVGTRSQVFYKSATWVKPDGVDEVDVFVLGAGGGGGGGNTVYAAPAGGGGAGAYGTRHNIAVTADVTVTVGVGGAGGAIGANNGSAGGSSSFGAFITANGGSGGAYNAASAAAGGTAGTYTQAGAPGLYMKGLTVIGGYFGGSNFQQGQMNTSPPAESSGAKGAIGDGGQGGTSYSGARNTEGGDGGNGIVIVTWKE
jgi:hypothetical protein